MPVAGGALGITGLKGAGVGVLVGSTPGGEVGVGVGVLVGVGAAITISAAHDFDPEGPVTIRVILNVPGAFGVQM